METRPTEWFNTKTHKVVYGIKVKHPKHGWCNASEGKGPLFFDNKQAREEKRAELRQKPWPKSDP